MWHPVQDLGLRFGDNQDSRDMKRIVATLTSMYPKVQTPNCFDQEQCQLLAASMDTQDPA